MAWCARTALLTLLVMAGSAENAMAQRICYSVPPGATAAWMAMRLTGDPRHRHAPWFHILDQSGRSIAKGDYDVIQPGWLACVDHRQRAPTVSASSAGRLQRAGGEGRSGSLENPMASVEVTFLTISAVFLAAASLMRFASRSRRQRARADIMRRFGEEFVREFGRPLTQFRGSRAAPVGRLRIRARRSQVEVLLAPAGGGSYPNLSDHRGNVEYDVARVLAALRRESFIRGHPYAEGRWVVLPFEFKDPVKQEGVQ